MKGKSTIIISGFLILLISLFYISKKKRNLPAINIISKNNTITLENYKNLFKAINFENSRIKEYFSKTIINKYTLRFFKFLQNKFRNKNFGDHMIAVENYLYSIMEEKKAEEMFELYEKYREYNIHQYELSKNMDFSLDTEEMIRMLYDLQEDRRIFFGRDIADALYGEEVKASEYDLRRMTVFNNRGLSGAEKEKCLDNLKEQMWGKNSSEKKNPWDQFNEKMKLYKDDLDNMSIEEKKEKIREFRKEFFPPEVTAQLERSDDYAQYRKNKKIEYQIQEQKILDDKSLTKNEKITKIHTLQNKMYGKYANLFRLRENYNKKLRDL